MIDVLTRVIAATAEGGEEMPSVLAVPLDELIIGLIAFLIVFGALGKFALPKIKATLDERADAIEGGLQRAEEAQAESQRVLEEYKQQLAQAREEASAIRTQAQADRTSIVEEARGEARQAAAQGTAAAEAQMAADRAQAMSTLTRQVGELSVELAGKVVSESLKDDARVRATVDAFLDDLERQAAR
ncbi:MAG: F0F1 ATP synthase subunit B [Actinomycetota bacterium]|nr:F0F1 ATP synthase subunit B [Actinomycetota bacterium]